MVGWLWVCFWFNVVFVGWLLSCWFDGNCFVALLLGGLLLRWLVLIVLVWFAYLVMVCVLFGCYDCFLWLVVFGFYCVSLVWVCFAGLFCVTLLRDLLHLWLILLYCFAVMFCCMVPCCGLVS